MFKDFNKYLTTTLKIYLFLLVIIFILKVVGLDYFGIDLNNPTINHINIFCEKYNLTNIVYCITLYINIYVLSSIVLNRTDKKLKLYSIVMLVFEIIMKILENIIRIIPLFAIIDLIYVFIFLKIFDRSTNLKKYIKVTILFVVYQMITLFIKNINYMENNDFIINFVLGIDYTLMQLITYEIYKKGGINLCLTEVYSSLQKKQNLKNMLTKLQENLHKLKGNSKEERLTNIIYLFLSLLWNTLSVVLILLVAKLNDTFIECMFILSSFWLSKKCFGKAFHLPSMTQCFIVSNLTYYTLNRITTPLGISIIVPILLGVGLSYVTSKLVRKALKPLYRGMPKDLFEDTILRVVDKNSTQYKICYEFYIERKSTVSLSMKYGYSEPAIRKIKEKVNKQIKEL